jgi:hypothetical protein
MTYFAYVRITKDLHLQTLTLSPARRRNPSRRRQPECSRAGGHGTRKLHRSAKAIGVNTMCAWPSAADYFLTFASIAFLASSCVYSWLATPPTGILGSAASKSS